MIYPFSPDDHSVREPPDPLPNSVVKPLRADGSVGSPHARVGHRQALIPKAPSATRSGLFLCLGLVLELVFELSPNGYVSCYMFVGQGLAHQGLVYKEGLSQSWFMRSIACLAPSKPKAMNQGSFSLRIMRTRMISPVVISFSSSVISSRLKRA